MTKEMDADLAREIWAKLEKDPEFVKSMEQGQKDFEEHRTYIWDMERGVEYPNPDWPKDGDQPRWTGERPIEFWDEITKKRRSAHHIDAETGLAHRPNSLDESNAEQVSTVALGREAPSEPVRLRHSAPRI